VNRLYHITLPNADTKMGNNIWALSPFPILATCQLKEPLLFYSSICASTTEGERTEEGERDSIKENLLSNWILNRCIIFT
jgi:hypothetical protein